MAEWMAYARVEPFGQRRDNWHMAVLASVLINLQIGKDAEPVKPDAFMWKITPTKAERRREERRKNREMVQKMKRLIMSNQAIALQQQRAQQINAE